ncbi:CDP-diacylglycerol--glycerol-3-phosphate 3-phosphatidyltransferase [Roseomonas elaeocarpi]|uniref:CDP-diacylglycerol--glycerol-3-phosphate 3-phosphatidyltransferase n=1 Tax=Roseomonas elaeocarpi TaxID=907779 RepID=A0ABV6JW14_9PROT
MPTDLPNLLTMSRIAAVPVLVLLAFTGGGWGDFAASMLFAAAAITDYFDGKIARDRQMTSAFGRMLDPIADKLLVGAALMLLAGLGRLSLLGLLPAIVILLREILVSGLREYLASLRVSMPVTNLAKWKTGFQMGALGVLLAGDSAGAVLGIPWARLSLLGEIGLWVAAGLTLITGWDYMQAGLRHAGAQDAQAVGTARSRS